MPTFRRREEGESRFRRPPGGAGGFRREPEEEEEAEPVRGGMRRGAGYSSPWQREWAPEPGPRATPVREQPRRQIERLIETMVPRSEREDPYFEYGKIFQILSPARGGRPEAGPREAAAASAPPPAAGPRRPGRARGEPPMVDVRNWFDDKAIFDAVRKVRTDSRFSPGKPVAIVQVAPASPNEAQRAADLIRFFRFPKAEVERYNAQTIWTELLHPFLEELAYGFDSTKPRDLPGHFDFQSGRDGSFWLGYME